MSTQWIHQYSLNKIHVCLLCIKNSTKYFRYSLLSGQTQIIPVQLDKWYDGGMSREHWKDRRGMTITDSGNHTHTHTHTHLLGLDINTWVRGFAPTHMKKKSKHVKIFWNTVKNWISLLSDLGYVIYISGPQFPHLVLQELDSSRCDHVSLEQQGV